MQDGVCLAPTCVHNNGNTTAPTSSTVHRPGDSLDAIDHVLAICQDNIRLGESINHWSVLYVTTCVLVAFFYSFIYGSGNTTGVVINQIR